MWCALSNLFARNCSNPAQSGDYHHRKRQTSPPPPTTMDNGEPNSRDYTDAYDTRQAKQRASVKWLLSKAFNNKVPENLKEPFYRDHENQEHLKPQIVGALANAEMYCLALGNIYSDPNYHNLNHWSILQTLARKGVYISEPSDSQLTETTLIQTNPLKISAHMAVIESMMTLYAKEVVTPDRVLATVQRFNHGRSPSPPSPETHEEGLLLWVSHACEALKTKIEQEISERGGHLNGGGDGDRLKPPTFPPINELKDLCDGVALAALISYYCPDELPWTELRVSYLPTVSESLHNLGLVHHFCLRCLPASVFHMMPEDVTYMRGSMKQNLVVFLADLFNVLEIHPVKCVRYPGMDKLNVSRSAPSHVPLRKTNSFQQSTSEMSEDSLRRGPEESFVVHRGRNIPTLSSMLNSEDFRVKSCANKENQNSDNYRLEDGKAAGKPSNWDENKRTSFSGRRSRRNSISEDSQLTIENFGGSQDNINFIGRNPDKEFGAHIGRKISQTFAPVENPAVRSSIQDARGTLQLGYDNGCEKQDVERENHKMKRQLSNDEISLRHMKNRDNNNLLEDLVDGEIVQRMNFADLKQQKITAKEQGNSGGIQLVYMQNEKFEVPPQKSNISNKTTNGEKKTTSFATLPNTTTWQQQSSISSGNQQNSENNGGEEGPSNILPSQLNDIKMKLEEKRRNIESEKRKFEAAMNKRRQNVGKAAFLQAVVKDIPDDGGQQSYVENKRTPDIDNMDMEQYQQQIAQMNSSLHDIQADIQRLASQSNQVHLQQQQQQQQFAQNQQQHMHSFQPQINYQPIQHPAFISQQQSYNPPQHQFHHHHHHQQQGVMYNNPLQSSASAPHLPQALYRPNSPRMGAEPQFFLHDHQPPAVPQRRTWAQQQPPPPTPPHNDSYHHHQHRQQQQQQQQPVEMRTWAKPQNSSFMLHNTSERYHQQQEEDSRYQNQERYHQERYQNGGEHPGGFTLSQQHVQHQQQQQLFGTPSTSPQHRNIQRQISQLLDEGKRAPVSLQQMDRDPIPMRKSSVTHAPIPAPPVDDMEPQNISFIGNPEEQQLSEGLSRLNITSGTRTYRIPSPTRPLISRNSFQPRAGSPPPPPPSVPQVTSLENDPKGFYISFDSEQPKRPKPPLRMKRASPKKERSYVEDENYEHVQQQAAIEKQERMRLLERELEEERLKKEEEDRRKCEQSHHLRRESKEASQEKEKVANASALIIGNDFSNPDPDLMDEREKKKEKIMLLSLQRRQQQEEAKERKEQEAQARREREKMKEEERFRKKEEQAQRRAQILEQYKLKKAIEEAEREGKEIDKGVLNSLKPTPKLRGKGTTGRPRPKTIHIDSGSVEMAAEGILTPSRGKKGSTSNLTVQNYSTQPSTMRRDYYRGSQDNLNDRGLRSNSIIYKDSPDDSRGMSPCNSANQTLARRSSYKTSRDPSPAAQVRGRPKYNSTYQNFKGRKSNSMMNLYGSSTDQDSFAYRYGDTDSGLGRATPPRRAPSPGMGPMRHLPSPSGPGSLPGLMSKRRVFDDGSSDISSTPSSMMDYTGPRLYKQPATKSNRNIMLNAVEYCVFPGVVNKEAKHRVLEEISRSESKHFLILFRDAGCQFRALYSYCPDREEVLKLYGTGPKQVNDRMFDKFFKYNSGGKCFSQVHTKHLTVTIDAFTIHNSLWQGKKVNLPNKKDMTLVI